MFLTTLLTGELASVLSTLPSDTSKNFGGDFFKGSDEMFRELNSNINSYKDLCKTTNDTMNQIYDYFGKCPTNVEFSDFVKNHTVNTIGIKEGSLSFIDTNAVKEYLSHIITKLPVHHFNGGMFIVIGVIILIIAGGTIYLISKRSKNAKKLIKDMGV